MSIPTPPVIESIPAPAISVSAPVPPVRVSAPAPVVSLKPVAFVEAELVTIPPTPEASISARATPPPVIVIGAVPALTTVIFARFAPATPTERAVTSVPICALVMVAVSIPVAVND